MLFRHENKASSATDQHAQSTNHCFFDTSPAQLGYRALECLQFNKHVHNVNVRTDPLQHNLLECDDVYSDKYQRFGETCYLSLRVPVLIPEMDGKCKNLLLFPSR